MRLNRPKTFAAVTVKNGRKLHAGRTRRVNRFVIVFGGEQNGLIAGLVYKFKLQISGLRNPTQNCSRPRLMMDKRPLAREHVFRAIKKSQRRRRFTLKL